MDKELHERISRSMPAGTERAHVGVALSGGADSVALLVSLLKSGYRCTALHCNFGLRGEESERDEKFVTRLCERLGCALRKVRFDVAARRSQTGESVEMACRELRYEWFARTAAEEGMEYVAIAHHREDNVETFFLNALRGSGVAGLAGMRPGRDLYVRPMLGVTRGEIENFLRQEGVEYVTDSSNLSDDYSRNRIRHKVLPAIEEAFPGATGRIARSMEYLRDDWRLLQSLVSQKCEEYVRADGSVAVGEMLEREPMASQLLYRILQQSCPGIQADVAAQIAESARQGNSGKVFRAGECTLLLDRGVLREFDESEPEAEEMVFDLADTADVPPYVRIERVERDDFKPRRGEDCVWLDADRMKGETLLKLRGAREGDRLEPFGMSGSRLLSDIFRDARLSASDKKQVTVIEHVATGKILYVSGLRASRHFAVTPGSRRIFKLSIISSSII